MTCKISVYFQPKSHGYHGTHLALHPGTRSWCWDIAKRKKDRSRLYRSSRLTQKWLIFFYLHCIGQRKIPRSSFTLISQELQFSLMDRPKRGTFGRETISRKGQWTFQINTTIIILFTLKRFWWSNSFFSYNSIYYLRWHSPIPMSPTVTYTCGSQTHISSPDTSSKLQTSIPSTVISFFADMSQAVTFQ